MLGRWRPCGASGQSSSLYQYVRVRLSSVRPGGVRHDTPEHTPCCLVPLISTTSGTGEGRDRKSTRLNSSHEWTSYAVFCLKKKNKGKNLIKQVRRKRVQRCEA